MLKLTIAGENYEALRAAVCTLAADMKFPGSAAVVTTGADTGAAQTVVETAEQIAARHAEMQAGGAVAGAATGPAQLTVSIDVDEEGRPWDERIDTGNKGKKQDGTWKRKPKVVEADYVRIKAEVTAKQAEAVAAQAAAQAALTPAAGAKFDPDTGLPIAAAPAAAPKFDPDTGLPITAAPAAQKFDPDTGLPIVAAGAALPDMGALTLKTSAMVAALGAAGPQALQTILGAYGVVATAESPPLLAGLELVHYPNFVASADAMIANAAAIQAQPAMIASLIVH